MDDPSFESLQAHYERKDMGHLWVVFFGGALLLGLIVLLGFLWGLQTALGHPPVAPSLRASSLPHAGDSATLDRFISRAPGLFPDPEGDLRRYRALEKARAPGYGWVDREAGIISIPIARALERIAADGPPRWTGD
jgi:hypothetical protein